MEEQYFIFDFDSTLTQVEALEVLAEISLKNNPRQKEILCEIQKITDLGIDGKISFTQSLKKRIALLDAHKDHLELLIKKLKRKISRSISSNKEFFKKHKDHIYIISCGFKEFIDPIVEKYKISSSRVYANTFKYNKKGKITGFDSSNVLSRHNGKIACLRQMELPGKVYVIGDGYSDYVMKEAGIADKFFAYTENVARSNILDKADHVTPSLDEFLYVNKLPMSISFPKNRIKVLLLEGIHSNALTNLHNEGYTIETLNYSPNEKELAEMIKDVFVLGIRSKTRLNKKVLQNAHRLLAVGAFCIGTTQIDLKTCSQKGIAVFNAPYSNTRSVVELALGEIIMLLRKVFVRSQELHQGNWNKSAKSCFELRGKKLGIVGYGNIGSQLSVLAEALGMQVYYYDIVEKLALGNANKCKTLKELLRKVDIVSVHVDDKPNNIQLFSYREFKTMKPGAIFLNLSRGFVVNIDALAAAIKSGKIAGAAIDVYPQEPREPKSKFITPLQGLENVILTPHIGGNTEEAQKNIAEFVPKRIVDYINTGNSFESVNFPNIQLPLQGGFHRLLHIHKNIPGILAQVNQILADYKLNVEGQYLKTNEDIGYLITDVNKNYNKKAIDALKEIEHTIKFRVLY